MCLQRNSTFTMQMPIGPRDGQQWCESPGNEAQPAQVSQAHASEINSPSSNTSVSHSPATTSVFCVDVFEIR